jgi:hypothetical protein
MIILTAFRCAPPFAQGLVRDIRVRRALADHLKPFAAKAG